MRLLRQHFVAYLLLTAGLWLVAPGAAQARDSVGFDRFCKTWMSKLEKRETNNLDKLKLRRVRDRHVGEYTGYERQPVRCQTAGKVKPGAPGVGTLVYREIRYRKAGPTPAAALKADPTALEAVEVMEIFRYDGKAWKY